MVPESYRIWLDFVPMWASDPHGSKPYFGPFEDPEIGTTHGFGISNCLPGIGGSLWGSESTLLTSPRVGTQWTPRGGGGVGINVDKRSAYERRAPDVACNHIFSQATSDGQSLRSLASGIISGPEELEASLRAQRVGSLPSRILHKPKPSVSIRYSRRDKCWGGRLVVPGQVVQVD